MSEKIAAIIPMRAQSVRVPRKNLRDFNGKPLYHWIVETLLACPIPLEVWIDTDSAQIIEESQRLFDVNIIERPDHLRGDTVPMNDVLLHDVTVIDADLYLQTHSTNPLLTPETIARAIEAFQKSESHDSLFSVTKVQKRFFNRDAAAINHDPDVLLRTQDLEPIYEENSCMYIFSRAVLESRGNRIGRQPLMYEIDPLEAVDIDEEIDFRIAELLHQDRANTQGTAHAE